MLITVCESSIASCSGAGTLRGSSLVSRLLQQEPGDEASEVGDVMWVGLCSECMERIMSNGGLKGKCYVLVVQYHTATLNLYPGLPAQICLTTMEKNCFFPQL